MGLLKRAWNPPGPVAARFMAATKPIQAILGPVGSGKTSACLMKLVKLARQQAPSPIDGVRRFRACVIRDTYRQLWKTTIPSWFYWVPKESGKWTGSNDSPSVHRIVMDLADGTKLDFEIHFIAIGDNNVKDVMSGYEATAFYLNEADLMAKEVLMYVRTRAGRYPKMDDGGPSWFGVLVDFNAPDIDNYLYDILVENPWPNAAFFRQPGGDTPQAENIANLPPGYYETMAEGLEDWMIRRVISAQFGYTRDGKPVYPEFNELRHVAAARLAPVRGLKLLIGADAGRTPGGAFVQRMPNGQWRILRELAMKGVGARIFGEQVARVLAEDFPDWPTDMIEAWGDPNAQYLGDQDEKSWLDLVSYHSAVRFDPCPVDNKDKTTLRESVALPLMESVDDAQPALIISPCCRTLIKGFASHFRYKRIKVAGLERYEDKPEKNPWSHPHEGVQYVLTGAGGAHELKGRRKAATNAVRQIAAVTDLNPRGSYSAPVLPPRIARMGD